MEPVPVTVVLYQHDVRMAECLASTLSDHSSSVHMARSSKEIRPAIARYRAKVLVLDLETSGLKDVEELHHEFPSLNIVCTHRLADEQLWAEALRSGASDMCVPSHTDEVVRSVLNKPAHQAAVA
jgi:DNA-binding NtrC family response regulator